MAAQLIAWLVALLAFGGGVVLLLMAILAAAMHPTDRSPSEVARGALILARVLIPVGVVLLVLLIGGW